MTIFFSNSKPKVPESHIFGFRFKHFCFYFLRNLKSGKSEGADFKYDNSFFKWQPKNTKIRHFWSQISGFLFLHQTLQQDKFEDADLKHDNNVFKHQPQNAQIRHFWSQI